MQLLTRSDFDGLICATLLKHLGLVDSFRFVHPKDVQDHKYDVTSNDILANVPYVPGAGLWFDHHSSEQERVGSDIQFEGRYADAPSCARVIWDYYGGHEKFPVAFDAMLAAVDKCDSADLTADEIEQPSGWILLGFLMDPRTGLGRYHDYRISNYQLAEALVDQCRTQSIDEIMDLPDVQERVKRYWEQQVLFKEMLKENAILRDHVIVLDLRNQPEIYSGNRFTVYALYPAANVSLQIIHGVKGQNVVITCGYSVVNRTNTVDVGNLMLKYGGGGHHAVGTCQVPYDSAAQVIEELIVQLNSK